LSANAHTPDSASLFIAVQHPGELRLEDNEDAEAFDEQGATWPDFAGGMPARPSVVVLTRDGGGPIGV